MNQRKPAAVFQKKIESIDFRLKDLKKIELVLSFLKLLFVIVGIFFLFRVVLSYTPFSFYAFLISFFVFVLFAMIHERYIKQRKFQTTLKTINLDEINAIQGAFLDYEDGEEFEDSDHAYAVDLSIFGKRSVFHFLNRTTTSLGKKVLSGWLQIFPEHSSLKEIRDRQEAVEELSGKIDFRQNIQAHGKNIHDSLEKLESVRLLFKESQCVLGHSFLIFFLHIFPVVTLSAIVLVFFNIMVVLQLLLGIIGVILSFIVAAFSMIVVGAVIFLVSLIQPFLTTAWLSEYVSLGVIHPAAVLFLSMATFCFGALWMIGNYYIVRYFIRGLEWYWKLNVKVFRGK